MPPNEAIEHLGPPERSDRSDLESASPTLDTVRSKQRPRLAGLSVVDLDALELEQQRQRLLATMFGVAAEPQQLQHYILLDELGRGGMGVVYAAYDRKLDRKVAIKMLRLMDGREQQLRLVREAKAMAKIAHPNVVQIHEIGETDEMTYIVMEYIEGVTLRQWLSSAPRSMPEILATFVAAGRGLEAAHAKGLVHRDFKPDNVMIRADGAVRVMDFGLASGDLRPAMPEHASTMQPTMVLTCTDAIMGTPAYMAPEQFAGAQVTALADQFGFSVALWEALYGERPFEDSSYEVLEEAVSSGTMREPEPSRVPPWLRQILDRGLSRDPKDRFESMAALLVALERDVDVQRKKMVSLAVDTGRLRLAFTRAYVRLWMVIVGFWGFGLWWWGTGAGWFDLAAYYAFVLSYTVIVGFQSWSTIGDVTNADQQFTGSQIEMVRGRITLLENRLRAWRGPKDRSMIALLFVTLASGYALFPMSLFWEIWIFGVAWTALFITYGVVYDIPRVKREIAELQQLAESLEQKSTFESISS